MGTLQDVTRSYIRNHHLGESLSYSLYTGFGKSMMKHVGFGGKWQLENGSIGPDHGEIPLNFGISSYFGSFHHAFSDLF